MGARQDLDKTLLQVADREQRLIAQELHDSLCQTLVGVSLLAKAALRASQRGGQVDLKDLTRISEHLDTAIEQTHALIQPHELSVRPAGLVRALEDLARFSSARIPCEFRIEGEASTTNPELAQTFHRVARESVQNILQDKSATRIEIILLRQESILALKIVCAQSTKADDAVFNGDGLLQRLVKAAGLDWSVGSVGGTSELQVSANSRAFVE